MASLTGQTIQSTYDGLLKTSDSDAITSSLKRITDGLGNFTPLYLSSTAVEVSSALTATSFIRTGGTSSQFLKADGSVDSTTYTPTSRTLTINGETYDLSANRSWTIAAGVTSFNTRTGAITLTSGDVTGALGFTPYNATNPAGYISGITRTQVINALGTGGSPFEFLKSDGTVDTNSYVTFGRTITINGTTQDLSADRTFNVGTVTSVSGTGTVSGLTLTGSVTSSGSLILGGTLTLTSGQVTSALGYTPVPNTRTLTINGTTFDLTADRSWTISGGISSLNGLTGATQTFATGTSGADFNIASTGTTHTFNIPTASSSTRGLLSAADWVIFANRISGSGTTNFVPKFNGATSLANSLIFDNGTNVGIGTTSPQNLLHVSANNGTLIKIQGSSTGANTNSYQAINGNGDIMELGIANAGYASGSYPTILARGSYLYGQNGLGLIAEAFPIMFQTSNTERMRITSGGLVGIGTSLPAFSLDTVSPANAQQAIRISNQNSGSSAYSTLIAAAFGNSWGFRVGSSAANGNNLDFVVDANNGGTSRMTITPGGNVGIGTSTPGHRLEVYTPTSDTRIAITNSNSTSGAAKGFELLLAGSDAYAYNYSNGALIFGTNNSQHMRITSGGNVGIGTSAADERLTIRAGNIKLYSLQNSPNEYRYIGTEFDSGNGNNRAEIRFAIDGSDTFTRLTFHTANGVNTLNERMRITAGGNVGIGTSSPEALLHLNRAATGGEGAFIFIDNSAGSTLGNRAGIRFATNAGATFSGYGSFIEAVNTDAGNGAESLTFGTWNGASRGERMRIAANGNVGIGTTNPVLALQVEGRFSVNTIAGNVSGTNCTASFRAITGTATDRVLEAYSIGYSALFYLQNNGSYFFAGSNLSDARAKKDITYFNEPILDKVMQLKPASFRYTQNDENIKGGFIAQEVKEIFPDLVTKTQDEDDLMGVDYYGVIALLTKAVQELTEKVNRLENK